MAGTGWRCITPMRRAFVEMVKEFTPERVFFYVGKAEREGIVVSLRE